MSTYGLSQPAPFDASSARASNAWQTWKTAFEYYLLASQVSDDKVKRAILLHCVGPSVQQLFATLDGTGSTYASALRALTSYFEPQRNVVFERHLFRQCSQHSGESTDDYCFRLRTLVASCEYGDQTDDHIRDQFLDQCSSKSLRRRLLREQNLKLSDLLSIARAAEAADNQASSMEMSNSPSFSVNDVRARQHPHPPPAGESQHFSSQRSFPPPRRGNPREEGGNHGYDNQNPSQQALRCTNCGLNGHRARDPSCLAQGQQCRQCQIIGHFSRVCRSSALHTVAVDRIHSGIPDERSMNVPRDDDETVFTVGGLETPTRVDIVDIGVDMLIDTGSSVNIIDSSTYNWMRGRTSSNDIRLAPSYARLFPYGVKTPLPVRGEFHAPISCSTGASTTARFIVVEGNSGSILGKATAIVLRLVKLENTQPPAHRENDISSAPLPNEAHQEASRNYNAKKGKKRRQRRQSRDINCGDRVIVKKISDRFSPRFDPSPWFVVGKKGGSVKIKRGNQTTTRYMSQVKKFPIA